MTESSDFQSKGRCVEGRIVKLMFRNRKTRFIREENVVYPALWTKGNVLASAREAHPESTVRLVKWSPFSQDGSFRPSLWIANPQKILNYDRHGKPGI